jgi:endonuclease/exonuclease/phosphatase family metal-dependent hydrolase
MNMWGWCLSAMLPRGWSRIGRGKTWPAHRPNSRIDHIAVAGGVQEVWSQVAPDLGSDHRAVRARLRVP